MIVCRLLSANSFVAVAVVVVAVGGGGGGAMDEAFKFADAALYGVFLLL